MSKSGDIFRLLVIGLLEISSSIEVIFVGCLHFQNLVAHTVVCISYVSVIFFKIKFEWNVETRWKRCRNLVRFGVWGQITQLVRKTKLSPREVFIFYSISFNWHNASQITFCPKDLLQFLSVSQGGTIPHTFDQGSLFRNFPPYFQPRSLITSTYSHTSLDWYMGLSHGSLSEPGMRIT